MLKSNIENREKKNIKLQCWRPCHKHDSVRVLLLLLPFWLRRIHNTETNVATTWHHVAKLVRKVTEPTLAVLHWHGLQQQAGWIVLSAVSLVLLVFTTLPSTT
jgi:hypothetical protein